MRNLPPLNAMKAFEVAARTGSFTRAARELGVSSAAVSQHIRNLEDYLGKRLFDRSGNRLTLTDAGHAIYPQTARALADLADVASRLLVGEARPRLVVSVPLSLAEPWLVPRLVALAREYPNATIDVRTEDDPVDLARRGIDLRVSYGAYHYPTMEGLPLFHDEVLPVCAPGFPHGQSGPELLLESLPPSAFIHTDWGSAYASHPTWSEWCEHAGSRLRPEPSLGRRVGLSGLAVAAARAGLGIALAQRMLTRGDREAGNLVALSTEGLKLGHAYHAFFHPGRARRKEVEALLSLMRN